MSRVGRPEGSAVNRCVKLAAAWLVVALLGAPSVGWAEAATPTIANATVTPVPGVINATLDHPFITIAKPLHRAHITGSVTATNPTAGLAVVLEARSGAFHQARSWKATTDSKGRFKFSFRPVFNAGLRVRITDGQAVTGLSDPLNQFVFPRVFIHLTQAKKAGDRVGFQLGEQGPPLITFDGGVAFRAKQGSGHTAYFYAAPKTGKTFTLVAKGPLRRKGCAEFCKIGASVRVPLTRRLVAAHRFIACARGTVFKGLGVRDGTCGRRTLKRSS